MSNRLMYVGITHETASVSERSYYSLDAVQKETLIVRLERIFPIKGILVLTTCNRTELYFESHSATPILVRDSLMDFVQERHKVELNASSFSLLNTTHDTVKHLLQVSSGLRSAVLGDGQIITQMRTAFKETLRQKRQGSLLERAFQSVFRTHKRIAKESLFQSGSSSIAYLSLKLIRGYFQKQYAPNKKVLLIGAGDMIQETLKYLKKFELTNVYIANRTEAKAKKMAKEYQIKVFDWQRVVDNSIESFDAVISAVGNRKYLINSIRLYDKKRIWIDLAVPFNIDKSIANRFNVIYDIDLIGKGISPESDIQTDAVSAVENIIYEELEVYATWLHKHLNRSYLITVQNKKQQHNATINRDNPMSKDQCPHWNLAV
ncbi:glutamyl-tRNA reductase [Flagellimonas sp. HMM57]|uniref:glutamyl-tRNA reductase n=1 Tax=unclassified Flagellimonas TaxID=2644544 RepID=UPI0013D4AE81|nr:MULTISPECIES: glutamyl-tRNA reductase [unclassified Flagellimonas]UII77321.1 glutamyl-tRNA reductase [Flagellimonas sp. HMM57]